MFKALCTQSRQPTQSQQNNFIQTSLKKMEIDYLIHADPHFPEFLELRFFNVPLLINYFKKLF